MLLFFIFRLNKFFLFQDSRPSGCGDLSFGVDGFESCNIHALFKQVLIVLQWVISWVEVLIWWSMSLLEGSVVDALSKVGLHLSSEVPLGEETIGWNPVVVLSWFVVPEVLEASGVGVREVEWHIRVAIIDSIALLSFHELLDVVLHNWALGVGSVLGSGGFSLDAVSESEDVLESRVLKGVWVHINEARVVGDSTVQKGLVWD